jgi:hypothetical protein
MSVNGVVLNYAQGQLDLFYALSRATSLCLRYLKAIVSA